MQQRVKGDGCAIVDTRGDTELANHVKPASIPSPDRPTTPTKTKLGRPVIEATGCWISRSQFGHTQGNDDHEDSDERPTNRGGGITHCRRNQVKEGNSSTKDRDDGKG